jgi:hydroxyethylthiazole kinase
MEINAQTIWSDIEAIRNNAPLIHNITNYVTMNNSANALLSIGASPVMAHADEEAAEMAELAKALVINIGTLDSTWVKAMKKAFIRAHEINVPVVIDPVGAGATRYRTETVLDLLSIANPALIRGNGSEILAISGVKTGTKGVDSTSSSEYAIEAGLKLSKNHHCVVCISGEQDFIIEDDTLVKIGNGHFMMQRVTGLGCTASALCGAFLAVNSSFLTATAHAMAVMGIAGEISGENAKGPGTLQLKFLDQLYSITQSDITDRLKLEVMMPYEFY